MKVFVFALVVVIISAASGLPVDSDENRNVSTVEERTFHFLNQRLRRTKKIFENSDYLTRSINGQALSGLRNPFLCTACKGATDILRIVYRTSSKEEVFKIIENTCTTLKIQTKNVCAGITKIFGPEILPILGSSVSSSVLCSFLLATECTSIDLPKWETQLPPQSVQVQPNKEPSPNDPKLKVLHLTDTHYDRFYTEGAKVDCDEPLCCRLQNGMATGKEKKAGKWGDWNCDIPERTLDNILNHAAKNHPDIDYIIWTGDIPAHDLWNQSRESNLKIIKSTAEKIKLNFPNISVYPAVGNHEAVPADIFPPPGAPKSISWLYDELEKNWRNWLPETVSETVKRGGFYTVLVRPKFRLISLNTNYCYFRNLWLSINSRDIGGQLTWLVQILKKAEENGEKVHIIAHIAPGQSDCLPNWRDDFYRIASRFRHTITNYFYGHSHFDEFELYYDVSNNVEPVGVGFLAPSQTTYTNLNPGYRIYYVDGDRKDSSRAVVDLENWVLDLDYTNKNDRPKWSKSYSAREEYGLSSLSPKSWNDFYKKLKNDNKLFQLYYKHSTKDSPTFQNCNRMCKKANLCHIRSCLKYE